MKKQKFSYHFTPAFITSNFVPLIVVLYGEDDKKLIDFEYKMWNVLQVCSLKKELEEEVLLKELIIDISQTHECEDYIFMYGETKGVDGSILKSIISEENTMYATASDLAQREHLKKVLDEFERMVPDL